MALNPETAFQQLSTDTLIMANCFSSLGGELAAYRLWNEDCLIGARRLDECSIDQCIHDAPWHEARETTFAEDIKATYRGFRNNVEPKPTNYIPGYCFAPENYYPWAVRWLKETQRILKPTGSVYVLIGDLNLRDVMNAAHTVGLYPVNQCVAETRQPVISTRKFSVCKINVLLYAKSSNAWTFDALDDNRDVWKVERDERDFTNAKRNLCRMSKHLIRKLIRHSSLPGDLVCDFFSGEMTTGICALELGRRFVGFEKNLHAFMEFCERLEIARKEGEHKS